MSQKNDPYRNVICLASTVEDRCPETGMRFEKMVYSIPCARCWTYVWADPNKAISIRIAGNRRPLCLSCVHEIFEQDPNPNKKMPKIDNSTYYTDEQVFGEGDTFH